MSAGDEFVDDVSGAAHLPAAASRFDACTGSGRAVTALRLEGVAPSVAHRVHALETLLKPFGALAALDETTSRALWRACATSCRSPSDDRRAFWRISTAPSRGHEIAAAIGERRSMFYDWAGGLIWLAMPPAHDGGRCRACEVRSPVGGHATLIRAPAALRARVAVFEPQDAGARCA